MGGVGLPHGLGWGGKARQATGRRQEATKRVFGIDSALDRPTIALDVGLADGEFFASGHTDHLLDQIEAGNALGHGVLHLQSRVHFQEVEVLVFAHHELYCARALVFDRLGQSHSLLAHGFAGGI